MTDEMEIWFERGLTDGLPSVTVAASRDDLSPEAEQQKLRGFR